MNGFWVFMLIMSMVVPLTMMFFGCLFYYKPPKNINSFYGYRTKRSMKNSKTWEFAHRYCGKLWTMIGIITAPFSGAAMCIVIRSDIDTIGILGGVLTTVQCALLVLTIPLTERALRKNFDEYGIKKEE